MSPDEIRDEIGNAFNSLSAADTQLLALRYQRDLSQPEVARMLGVPEGTVQMRMHRLRGRLRAALENDLERAMPQPTLFGPDGTPLGDRSKERRELDIRIAEISDELIRLLADNPDLVYALPARRFEELIAELYQRRGFDAKLTPASRDGGVDVFVTRHDELGTSLCVVQCKRYAPNRKVGVGLVRELQGALVATQATAGVLLTSSFFTRDARALEARFPYQVSLQDYLALQTLLRLPPAR